MALPRRRLLVSFLLSTAAWATHVVPAEEPGLLAGAELALVPSLAAPAADEPDVVVYGGTPAGVAAAIGAADHGARVTLLAEGSTVGGLMSNGISASDVGSEAAVQGVALEFFEGVRKYYGDPDTWRFEPRIAERVLRRMLDDAGVDVRLQRPLRGVTTEDRRITCLQVPDGEVCGANVVDASYTGEVIAAADVPHRLGLGDLRAHGEYMADRRGWTTVLRVPGDQVEDATAAFEANPFVRVDDDLVPYEEAAADGAPSLTYRLCVTADASNRIDFRPAPGYAELLPSFRVMARRMADDVQSKSNGTLMSDAFHLARLPEGKYDLNAGRLSYTNVPAPEGYFDSAAERQHANRTLENYVRSFFHFVRTDPTVPPSVQDAFRPFGLCADEFTDNDGWPREPYVREGRRIVGRTTLTVADIFGDRLKSDAVAVGSYQVDGKLSRVLFVDGALHRDLGVHTSVPVYEIPFAAMVPARGSVTNLLAPVGLSASPTAYGSVRMEPQYMALGQAAGVAAALATRDGLSVAALPAARVQGALRHDGVVHTARGVCERTAPDLRPAGGFTPRCRLAPFEQD